jgi:NAD+ diphosphatase
VGPLGHLLLARSGVEREAHHRSDPDLVRRLREDPTTAVLRLRGDRALTTGPDALDLDAGPTTAPDALWLYLGREPDGREHLASWEPAPDGGPSGEEPDDWRTLREVGASLGDRDAGLFTTAQALANWHATHPRCSRCGAPTEASLAGWTRTCTVDGSEHYPRTDPAIIVAVRDEQDRILLGHGGQWPPGRFSTLAGFVEPGESIEDAVRREVGEESGVVVGAVSYLGSQPWPFPASLMIGCAATALDPRIEVDGIEVTEARWFSREDLRGAAASGEVQLPSGISIARRLVEHWYGGPLPSEGTWR